MSGQSEHTRHLRDAVALIRSPELTRNDIAEAGALIEGVACSLPGEVPLAGSLLSLALEVLQQVFGDEDAPDGAVEAAADAAGAAADILEGGGFDAEPVHRVGTRLWSMLGRAPELSPFNAPSTPCTSSEPSEPSPTSEAEAASEPADADAAPKPERSVDDWAALLIGLDPDDHDELAEVHGWLASLSDDEDVPDAARSCARSGAAVVSLIIDGEAPDPRSALEQVMLAVTQLQQNLGDAGPEAGSGAAGERTDGEQREPEPDAADQADVADEPVCLQFEGDTVLLAEFAAESIEHIEAAEVGMLAVEADPDDSEAVNAVFRAFHTIKGTAGFLGLAYIQQLAHRAENLLDRVREGEIQLVGGYADLALASSDTLREMIEGVRGWEEGDLPPPPDGYDDLMERLDDSDAYVSEAASAADDAGASAEDDDDASAPEGDAQDERGTLTGGVEKSSRATATARVRTDRLDALINMVGELVIANAMLAQDEEVRRSATQEVESKIDQISKITRDLQDVAMSLRMVPLRSTFHKMARVVRDIARKSGKQIDLVTEGDDTEIDRNMVESITDPLMHMVRNAADHGIEPPEERRAAGKPPTGTVTLRAYHSAGSVVIEIADDGRGLDRDAIYEKAVAAGEIGEGDQLTDEQVYRLIFSAGLSTAREVTDVSGRGVGMDVVRRNIESMRGRVDIASTPGKGSTFSIRVPLTLAIIDGMLMRVGDERYIVPTVGIQQAFCPTAEDVQTVAGAAEMVRFRGDMIPLLRVHELFDVGTTVEDLGQGNAIAVVVERDGDIFALLVDELFGQQQIVIKSLGEGLADARTVAGAAILGDGSVGLILNVEGLVSVAQDVQRQAKAVGGARAA